MRLSCALNHLLTYLLTYLLTSRRPRKRRRFKGYFLGETCSLDFPSTARGHSALSELEARRAWEKHDKRSCSVVTVKR